MAQAGNQAAAQVRISRHLEPTTHEPHFPFATDITYATSRP